MVAPLGRRSGRKISQVRNIFLSVNMKNCGCRKFSKHKEVKDSDKSVTLEISSKFDILKKMKTASS